MSVTIIRIGLEDSMTEEEARETYGDELINRVIREDEAVFDNNGDELYPEHCVELDSELEDAK